MSPRKTKYIGGHMEVKTSIGFRALRHSVVEKTIRKMNAYRARRSLEVYTASRSPIRSTGLEQLLGGLQTIVDHSEGF